MEEKIVGKMERIFPLLLHLFHSLIYRISLICLHLHCACARPTTPLWFTDNTGSCVRLNEQYSTGQSDLNGRHQWNGTVGDRRQNRNSSPQTRAHQDHCSWLEAFQLRTRTFLLGKVYIALVLEREMQCSCTCDISMGRTKFVSSKKWNSGKRTCDQGFLHTSGNIWRVSWLTGMYCRHRSQN